jgi:hypothetical protein
MLFEFSAMFIHKSWLRDSLGELMQSDYVGCLILLHTVLGKCLEVRRIVLQGQPVTAPLLMAKSISLLCSTVFDNLAFFTWKCMQVLLKDTARPRAAYLHI